MKRLVVAGILAIAMLGCGIGLSPMAHAHSELVSSDPADGAQLDAPPTTVSFTFNEDLLPDFVRLIATSPAGATGDLAISAVEGPTVTATWPDAEAGTWTVNYRVVSQDGHPIEGGITFTYAAASPSPSPSGTSASASPAPSETSAPPTSAAPSDATPSPSISPAADVPSGGLGGWVIAVIAIAVIAAVGVVLALVVRRRA